MPTQFGQVLSQSILYLKNLNFQFSDKLDSYEHLINSRGFSLVTNV